MGDSRETLEQVRKRRIDEAYARDRFLCERSLLLDKDSMPWILNRIAYSCTCWRIRHFATDAPWRWLLLATATAAGQRVRLLVVVEESGSKPVYPKAGNPAGDSRSFDLTGSNAMGNVSTIISNGM
jgi:hypothetical protein